MTEEQKAKRVLLVIPAFNEERRLNVPAILEDTRKLRERLEAAHPSCHLEILWVNDGSRDGTQRVLDEMCAQDHHASSLSLPQNVGKAEAVRQGFVKGLSSASSHPAFIGYWDADGATPYSEVENLLKPFLSRESLQVSMGSRVKLLGRDIQRRAVRHYLGRVFATFVSWTLNLAVYDTQCGAKIFRVGDCVRQSFASPFVSRWIFDVEILSRLQNCGMDLEESIVEVPLQRWVDVAGSKVKPLDFLRAAMELAQIAWDRSRTVRLRPAQAKGTRAES